MKAVAAAALAAGLVLASLVSCDVGGGAGAPIGSQAELGADAGGVEVKHPSETAGPDVLEVTTPADGDGLTLPDAADTPLSPPDVPPDTTPSDGEDGDGGHVEADIAAWRCVTDGDCLWLARTNTEPCLAPHCERETGACVLAAREDGTGCDDGEPCTVGEACLGGSCAGGEPDDCDDGDPCTSDRCTAAAGCTHTPVEDCCLADDDCDDGNPCTNDRCPGAGTFCKHRLQEGCCTGPADCDDGDPCTEDRCTAEGCARSPICCVNDDECDDGLECTEDRCLEGTCVAVVDALSACCTPTVFTAGFDGLDPAGFTFAGGVGEVRWNIVAEGPDDSAPMLYYGDPARRSYDTGGSSTGTATSPTFLLPDRASASLTFRILMNTESYYEKVYVDLLTPYGAARLYTDSSGSHAWEQIAVDLSGAAGLPARVAFVFFADGSVFDEGVYIDDIAVVSSCALHDCAALSACDDTNGCTAEDCLEGVCAYTWSEGCCAADADCDDGEPCTNDRCQGNVCTSTPTSDPSCCATDDDCGGDDPCLAAVCEQNRCELSYDEEACPLALPYAQPFDDVVSFGGIAWTTVNELGGSQTNWVLRTPDGIFPTRFARFDWTPAAIDYEHCLRSPNLLLGGAHRATVAFDTRFSSFVGTDADNQLSLRWSTDDWSTDETLWAWHEREGDIERRRIELPLELSPLAGRLSVAFCVSGQSSYEISSWDVDELELTVGEPPRWVSTPAELANLAAFAGQMTAVELFAQDPEGDPLTFALSDDAPPWARLEPLSVSSVRLELSPSEAELGRWEFAVLVDDGGAPVPLAVSVQVALAGEEVLLEEGFEQGGFEERGWLAASDPGSASNDWFLAIGDPFASRHARFAGQPPVTSFNDTLTTPPIATADDTAFRVRWQNELLTDAVAADPELSVALQVAADGGLWETVWSHTVADGPLPAGLVNHDLSPQLARAETFQLRFRVRGSQSVALYRWVVDEVRVLGRPVRKGP